MTFRNKCILVGLALCGLPIAIPHVSDGIRDWRTRRMDAAFLEQIDRIEYGATLASVEARIGPPQSNWDSDGYGTTCIWGFPSYRYREHSKEPTRVIFFNEDGLVFRINEPPPGDLRFAPAKVPSEFAEVSPP